jgi:hypothetical protein
MWVGLLLAAGIETTNLIHGLFPAFPEIPLSWDLRPYIQERPPWDAIRWATVGVWPTVVGICYLMPLDMAFSLWFFNLWFKAQLILASHFGWTTNTVTGFPYIDNQSMGGFFALLISVLWLDRHYLVQVARRALGLHSVLDESREAMSYRGAVLLLAVATGFLAYFFGKGGMPLWLALAWIANFLLLGLAITRIRAQLGPPVFELWAIGPHHFLPMLLGNKGMSPRAQGAMWITYPIGMSFGSNPQPWTLESFKLAQAERRERRALFWALVAITPVVIVSIFWATLHVVYNVGVASNADPYSGDHMLDVPYYLSTALEDPIGPDYSALGAIAVGMVGAVILMAIPHGDEDALPRLASAPRSSADRLRLGDRRLSTRHLPCLASQGGDYAVWWPSIPPTRTAVFPRPHHRIGRRGLHSHDHRRHTGHPPIGPLLPTDARSALPDGPRSVSSTDARGFTL